MYVVITRGKLRIGTSDRCAELFRQSNPDLVSQEEDWLGARMIFNSEINIVTVLATWRNAESYKKLSASPQFQNTMQKFGELFAFSPEITTILRQNGLSPQPLRCLLYQFSPLRKPS